MKSILKYWQEARYLLTASSICLFLAACFTSPVTYRDLGIWTITVHDEQQRPIEGLQITVRQRIPKRQADQIDTMYVEATDTNGSVMAPLYTYDSSAPYRHEAVIKDIDSTLNGGAFADTMIFKGDDAESIAIMRAE